MTTIEASNKLLEWFAENDIFCISDDFEKVFPRKDGDTLDDKDLDKASAYSALKQLKEAKIVSEPISVNNKDFYVLAKNLKSYDQPINLSGNTCMLISATLNSYCDIANDQDNRPDIMNITEKDINNLVAISMLYLNSVLKGDEKPQVEQSVDFSNN